MSEYADDIRIDKFNLDVEWEMQPAKYIEWATKLSVAILERDQCKQRIDVLRAQLDRKLRVELEKQLGKKPTEGAISAAIDLEQTYQDIQDEYHQINYQVNILTAARNAFEQRKKALEYLTQLYLSSYFSKPVISEESKYKVGERKKNDTSQRLTDRMRRRKHQKDEMNYDDDPRTVTDIDQI